MNLAEMLKVGVNTSLQLPVQASVYRAIIVHLEPHDLDVYRNALPAPLTTPDNPKLLFELSEVTPHWLPWGQHRTLAAP